MPAITAAILLTGSLLGLPGGRPGEESLPSDEETLRAAKVGTDAAALLDYFRKRTVGDVNQAEVDDLIRQLGDDSFEVRERASARLVALGTSVTAALERATHDSDVEVAHRAERCLGVIKGGGAALVPAAAARLLARSRPPGAAGVLLAYLPSAESDLVAEEVRRTLAGLAVRDGRADPEIVAALKDRSPIRRAAAATALLQGGAAQERAAVRQLLRDADRSVRLHVALLFATSRDVGAVPVLIDLIGQLPAGESWQAVDFLCRLAGDSAPAVFPGEDAASRQDCQAAWRSWWQKHRQTLDLGVLERAARVQGYTMVVLLDKNLVMELDQSKKPRWKIEEVQRPLDAQLLPGGRVLVAEQGANRVTERTLDGKVVWEKAVEGPLMAQRLANGHTFICNPVQLLEVDRSGKEVFTHALPAVSGDQFMRAAKLPNGNIACVMSSNRFIRMDATGKEIQSFGVQVATSGGRIEVLPTGHVLVPQKDDNKVIEYDSNGKPAWEVTVEQPIAAVRLANGNTLVTSMSQNRAVELDRTGKEVWEYRADTRVTRAWRR